MAFRLLLPALRAMSTAATDARKTFIVLGFDPIDAGALDRRLAVRPKHFERARALYGEGTIQFAGAMLDADKGTMKGSMLIVRAETLDAARRLVEEDIYFTAGVWDKDKLTILPFVEANLAG